MKVHIPAPDDTYLSRRPAPWASSGIGQVHDSQRRTADWLVTHASRLQAAHPSRRGADVRALLATWRRLVGWLHNHENFEERGLFPQLRQRGVDTATLETHHDTIRSIRLLAAQALTQLDSDTSEEATRLATRRVAELRDMLHYHLEQEEQLIMPHITGVKMAH